MRLQLKRSNVLASGSAKTPTASQLEYGELAINYNTDDPAIFLKDSNNNVIRISGVGNIADDGQVELPATTTPPSNPQSGNLWYNSDDGRLYIYYTDADSSQWVDASPDSWDPTVLPDTTNSNSQSGTLDDRYLMLNSGNDPVTGGLNITGGNVGIGTSSPSAKLEVTNSSGTGNILLADFSVPSAGASGIIRMINRNAADTGTTSVDFYKAYQGGFGIHNNDTASSNFTRFIVGASERMRLTADGNMGIGTSSPNNLLDVQGASNPQIKVSATNTGTNSAGLYIENQGQRNWQIWADRSSDQLRIGHNSRASTVVSVTDSRVGIGASSPLGKLHVRAADEVNFVVRNDSNAIVLSAETNSGRDNNRLMSFEGSYFNFTTSGTERLTLQSNGYVGINVTNPAYQLDVQGYLRVGEFSGLGLIQLGKSSEAFRNYHIGADSGGGFQIWNGNIGAGTSKLQVASNGDLTTFGNIIVRGNTIEGGEIQLRNPNRTDVGAYFDISSADVTRWFSLRNNTMWQIGQFSGTGGNIRFYTSGAQRAKIETNGHFLIHQDSSSVPGSGNVTTGACFERANDGTTLFVSRSQNTPCVLNRNSTGNVVRYMRNGNEHGRVILNSNGTVSYSTNSDYRLKENVVVLDNAIDRVKQLLPKQFNFLESSLTVDGFLAHEAQTVVPEAVDGSYNQTEPVGTLTEWDGTVLETDVVEPDDLTWEEGVTDEDGNQSTETRTRTWTQTGTQPVYQSIDQAKLVPLLTAALQEAITRIEALENAQ